MRRSGKTTRLVDRLVQEYFDKGTVYIYEGRGEESERNQTREALHRFRKRMESEHPMEKFEHVYGEYDQIMCYKVTKK